MGSVVKKLFGGTDTSAQQGTIEQNEATRRFIEQQGRLARSDVLSLFPGADINRNLGFQGALDVFGQTIPQQFGALQQGNVGAQEAILAGLPQFQNAILGLPTDLSGLQPQTINIDTGFAQQQLPGFTPTDQLIQPQPAPTAANFLAGRRI